MEFIFGLLAIIILLPISIIVLLTVFTDIKIDENQKKKLAQKKLEEDKKKQEEERKTTEEMRAKVRETELYNQMLSFFCKRINGEISCMQNNIATAHTNSLFYSESFVIGELESSIGFFPKPWNTLKYKDFGVDSLYSREQSGFKNTLKYDLEQKYPELEFRFDYDDYRAITVDFSKFFRKMKEDYCRKPIC